MTVVSVSMSEELLGRLDHFAEAHGYTGRSEVVREAARSLLGEFEEDRFEDRVLLGVVTATFPVGSVTLDDELLSLRREHEHLITSNVHSRITDQYCVELVVLEGRIDDISTFIRELRARGTPLAVEYSLVPVDEIEPAGAARLTGSERRIKRFIRPRVGSIDSAPLLTIGADGRSHRLLGGITVRSVHAPDPTRSIP